MVIDISGFLVIYPSFSVVADKPDIEMKHLGMMVWTCFNPIYLALNILKNTPKSTSNTCNDIPGDKGNFIYFKESCTLDIFEYA